MNGNNQNSSGLAQSLTEMMQAGAAFKKNQEATRRYMHSLSIASSVIGALSNQPGFIGGEIKDVGLALIKIVDRLNSELKFIFETAEKKGYGDLIRTNYARSQITRFVAGLVAKTWVEDQFSNDKGSGNRTHLVTGYTEFLARHLTQRDDTDSMRGMEPEYLDNYEADRLLAAHTAYQRIDEALNYLDPFLSSSLLRLVLLGEQRRGETRDLLTDRLLMEVIYPITDERHKSVRDALDEENTLSKRDQHILYRSLLAAVSKDAAIVIRFEHSGLADRIRELDDEGRARASGGAGVLIPWLRERISQRLDRLYPRPDEHGDKPLGEALEQAEQHEKAGSPSNHTAK